MFLNNSKEQGVKNKREEVKMKNIRVCAECLTGGFRSNWKEKIHDNKRIWCDWCQKHTRSKFIKKITKEKEVKKYMAKGKRNKAKLTIKDYEVVKLLISGNVKRSVIKKATGWSSLTISRIKNTENYEDYRAVQVAYAEAQRKAKETQKPKSQGKEDLGNREVRVAIGLLQNLNTYAAKNQRTQRKILKATREYLEILKSIRQ